ncbi:putative altered inheritance of mitochondria protein 13, mitochondrial [Coniochaeta sp. PMI_546]|nr:putative altered inheritance of mitochondria protein 13, mitochondrial [Coniochaeta sp. PMI_546]
MGSSSSKPSGTASPHVWKGSAPTASSDILESLQSSNETDVSRSQALELQIQARVAAELKRLQEEEAAALRAAEEKLSAPSPEDDSKPSRQAVSKEVEALRQKLESRRKVREIPASVENARSEVVRCLRENDRRPLDCWKEVEAFKEEVRRLEKGWVEKVVG